uniref:NLP effector protein 9 n=1 Tax=Plasmopara viticola TaxID=143451 RepID=NLP9_PLAVT|nr:RecName: Full=NLP effector protein 9; AltName: Full=Nep1-like protein 9; Flags: Precursor [Plasmopara viticola]UVH27392.1 NEP1-like protein 9 [Plasmopara viticola]
MKISNLLGVLVVFLAVVKGQKKDEGSDDSELLALVTVPDGPVIFSIEQVEQVAAPSTDKHLSKLKPKIAYDKVEPFEMAQPSESTITEKAAIKFRPKLYIANGCHAYPAVNKAGQISKGMKTADPTFATCGKPSKGTQVYGRSAWFGTVWAIMYAWYFPDIPLDWEYAIVWTNNPNVSNPVILGVTVSNSEGSTTSQTPPDPAMVDGRSVKIAYNNKGLESSTTLGGTQNLVMWHQLTVEAQEALNKKASFNGVQVPMNDNHFLRNLEASWPFSKEYLQ